RNHQAAGLGPSGQPTTFPGRGISSALPRCCLEAATAARRLARDHAPPPRWAATWASALLGRVVNGGYFMEPTGRPPIPHPRPQPQTAGSAGGTAAQAPPAGIAIASGRHAE